ncbi:glycosyltransferase [Proteus myxofaciens]|uniref:Lipopolysaccharide core biosynthesis glycosyltransferase n=1 Tax=Proteus myxofaciens ATCC 19692 TaxID=1354337 RepID=A0A198FX15_9GAMM|nr:glycosyltransferase [Proteus myxofaciens]OAT28656.1 lipopolysaccharide core biosynthesis glycosyltransferase [Proteus myxofaciens ATCC 19692]
MNQKHILFIIDGLPGGGAENVTLRLANGFYQAGYQVTLLSLDKKLAYELPDYINYIVDQDAYRGIFRKLTEISRRAKSLDSVLEQLFIDKGIPELVLSNLHKTDRIVSRSKKLATCNVWYCIHGIYSQSYLGNKSGFSYWLKKNKIKHVYKNKKLVCVSNAVKDDLINTIDIHAHQLKTIYNPFNTTEIQQKALQPNPFSQQDYILHVGRLHEVKRQDRLIEAFSKANLPCQLIILGEGTPAIKQRLEEQIIQLNLTEKVKLAGFISNPLPVIKNAKVVALSSDSEGLPTVLIEALICGTPIASTRCPGGVSEIMTDELANYLSDMNVDSLAEKLRLAYYSPPEILPSSYSKFELNHILKQYIALIP